MGVKDPGLASLMRYAFGRVSWGWRQVCLDCKQWPSVKRIAAISTAAVASSGSEATLEECDPATALPCADNSNKCIFWAQSGECAKVVAALPAAACRAR
jgi:hypothetical protein